MTSKFAMVFPGQGSQSLGMLSELAQQHAIVKDVFDQASEGAEVDLWAISQQNNEGQLDRTEFTQPALLAAGIAVWRVWQSLNGTSPSVLAGHSLGEYTALVAAGALTVQQGAYLVRQRGKLMQQAVAEGEGAMAAVLNADPAILIDICQQASQVDSVVVPANFNSSAQIVIGGHTAAVARAIALLAEAGIKKAIPLPVSVPSHTPLMREAANQLAEVMKAMQWELPALPVIQNVDACSYSRIEDIQDALVRQLYLPVRWSDCITQISEQGIETFAECGPGKVLSGLIKRINKNATSYSLGMPDDLQQALIATSSN